MIQALLGRKIDQTQKFLQDGTRVPVTEILVPDNAVVQVKTQEKDHYTALQIGLGKKKKPTKATLGHAKKANLATVPYTLREIKITLKENENLPKAGDFLKIEEVFKPGDIVQVQGISKGKGFAGVVKRHNFRGGPKTHGQSDRERAPGSIGQTTTPGRVYKGKRMAGRMGSELVTVKNLKVVGIDEVNRILLVAGLVPGVKNSILCITRTGENKKFVPLYKKEEPLLAPEPAPESQAVVEPKSEKKQEAKENKPTEKTEAPKEIEKEKKGENKENAKS